MNYLKKKKRRIGYIFCFKNPESHHIVPAAINLDATPQHGLREPVDYLAACCCRFDIGNPSIVSPDDVFARVSEGSEVANVWYSNRRGKALVACVQMPLGAAAVMRYSERFYGMDYRQGY